jgi:hypothetical protein
MPYSGKSNKESTLQTQCMKYLRERKIYHINTHGGGWCGKGTPDLIVCINGLFVAFELKVGENDMQPDQKIIRKNILDSSGFHYCPRSFDEFTRIIDEFLTMKIVLL